ncbi:MAG: DUF1667 domain-containing protein [Methylocystaceae bacterium]
MLKNTLTCILCPLGCQLHLKVEAGEVREVTGNSCKQGLEYAGREYTCPTRILTATAALNGASINRVPVKTAKEVPRSSIGDCMTSIKGLRIEAPVSRGQVLVSNLAETGVELVASRSIGAR